MPATVERLGVTQALRAHGPEHLMEDTRLNAQRMKG
jgi:hypothetical protein